MRLITINILFLGFLFACKKDDVEPIFVENECDISVVDTVQEPVLVENKYYPMSVGSYWIYEFDAHLYDGTIINNNQIDTIKIIGDTIVNGNLYYIFHSNMPINNLTYLQRNKDGKTLSGTGSLICSADDNNIAIANEHYGSNGQDTVYHFWESFSGYVPIGTAFGTQECIQKLTYHNYWPGFGVGLVTDTSYYSPIGQLQRSFSYSSGLRNVGVLVDYHIE